MFFCCYHQLFEQTTSTYTYIVADGKTREALIIDPVIETVARDVQLLKQLDLRLRYASRVNDERVSFSEHFSFV